MRGWGIALCLVCGGCPFDTSTNLADPTEIDAGPAGPGDAGPDAPPDGLCAMLCTGPGASCAADGTCEFNCTESTGCVDIVCPPGIPCKVTCEATSAQSPCNDVSCSPGQPCDVNCIDALSGATARACESIDCNGSCACDVKCTGSEWVCQQTDNCPAACATLRDCAIDQPECDTCPVVE